MNERPLDQVHDWMIAALYGELAEEERAQLEAALEQDEDLRREWDELNEARACLQLLDEPPQPAAEPFRFASPAAAEPVTTARVIPLRQWLLPAAAGFAAAATLFLGLLLAGLRVDRTPGGVLVGFGTPTAEAAPAAQQTEPAAATDTLLASQRLISREELAMFAQVVAETTVARLNQLEQRQTRSQAEVAQALYEALAVSQQRQYVDLRNRIELAVHRGGISPYTLDAPADLH